MLKLTVFLLVIAVASATLRFENTTIKEDDDQRCGQYKFYSNCANSLKHNSYCNQFTSDYDGPCKPGCACKPGMVRMTIDSDICVPKEFCSSITCKDSEVYKICGKCQKTCAERYRDFSPTCIYMKCRAGCYCKDRYFLSNDSEEADCIPEGECTGLGLL